MGDWPLRGLPTELWWQVLSYLDGEAIRELMSADPSLEAMEYKYTFRHCFIQSIGSTTKLLEGLEILKSSNPFYKAIEIMIILSSMH